MSHACPPGLRLDAGTREQTRRRLLSVKGHVEGILRMLEDERYADLPARVFVRGFVTSYASCMGLNPGEVADYYMRRFDQARLRPPRRGGVR